MTFPDQTTDPEAKLVAWLRRLENRVTALERRGLVIPIVDVDPDDTLPGEIWMLEDGRLRTRNAGGDLKEWPDVTALRPALPTFATDPAASTGWRMWLRGSDGQLRVRQANDAVRTFDPTTTAASGDGGTGSTGSGTSTVSKPATGRTHTHRQVWTANGTGCYCPVHGRESRLYYGRWDGTHGERRLMFGFDDAAIRTALSGASIRVVEMRVQNLHANLNSGVYIHWGGHNQATLDASFHQRYRDVWKAHWPKVGGDVWRTMPAWFGTAFRDNKIKGLTVDQSSTSRTLYGQLATGLDLRITYSHKH